MTITMCLSSSSLGVLDVVYILRQQGNSPALSVDRDTVETAKLSLKQEKVDRLGVLLNPAKEQRTFVLIIL